MIRQYLSRLRALIPDWLRDPYVLGTFVAIFLFVSFLAWGPVLQDPQAGMLDNGTGAPTATPMPEEWQRASELTNGIVFMGGIIILIVVGGTLGVLRSRRQ